MNTKSFVATVALGMAASLGVMAQQVPHGVVLVTPENAQWTQSITTGAVRGVDQVIVQGHPSKPGPYLNWIKFPPNFRSPAHSHPEDRANTVLSGTWYVGFGEKLDESKLIALPAGSFYTEPAGIPHFTATKGEPAVLQIGGVGPTRVIYLDPATDPSKKK